MGNIMTAENVENEVYLGDNFQIRDIKVRNSSAKSTRSTSSFSERKAAFTARLESMSREELASKYRRDLKKVVEIRRSNTDQLRANVDSNVRVVKSSVSVIEDESLQPLAPWFQFGLFMMLGLFCALIQWVFDV